VTNKLPDIDDDDDLAGDALAAQILESLDEAISAEPDLHYRIRQQENITYGNIE
jgi:hypothetical protein